MRALPERNAGICPSKDQRMADSSIVACVTLWGVFFNKAPNQQKYPQIRNKLQIHRGHA